MAKREANRPRRPAVQRQDGIFNRRAFRADRFGPARLQRLQAHAELLGPDTALAGAQRSVIRALRREGFVELGDAELGARLPPRWYSVTQNKVVFASPTKIEREPLDELAAAFIAINDARAAFQRLLDGLGLSSVKLVRALSRDSWEAGRRLARYEAYRTRQISGKRRSEAALPRRQSMLTRTQVQQAMRSSSTCAEAAANLGITERHLRELRKRYGLK